MKYLTHWLLLLAAWILLCASAAEAQKGRGDLTGLARTPGEVSIKSVAGELLRIESGPCEQTTGYAYVGTHLFIKDAETGQELNIHLGASNAVAPLVDNLKTGQRIEAEVIQTQNLEPRHYIARTFSADGHTRHLRDEYLRPFWSGERLSSTEARRSGRYLTPRRERGGRW